MLASSSRYRRELLERLGVCFTWVSPPVDEAALKRSIGPVEASELTIRLAEAKARSVVGPANEAEAVVIGSDQVLCLDGEILGKPETEERAVAQLGRLAGRSHELVTALVVVHPAGIERHVDVARLTMRSLGKAEIERYVRADRPLDCAGSYKLESRGIALFERLEAPDPTAITGLPLMALTTILRGLGVAVP